MTALVARHFKSQRAFHQGTSTSARALGTSIDAELTVLEIGPRLQQGIDVSPNLVSIIRAKAGVKRARRNAHKALATHDQKAGAKLDKSAALDAALILYKAADGRETRTADVRDAFLRLMAYIG